MLPYLNTSKTSNRPINFQVCYWFFISLFVIFFYTQSSFIRPTDDPKELILYSACFIYGSHFFVRLFFKNGSFRIDLIIPFLVLFLIYGFLNIFLTQSPLNEGIVFLGRFLLLISCIYALSFLEVKELEKILTALVFLGLLAFFLGYYYFPNTQTLMFFPIGHLSYFSDFLLLLLPWGFYQSLFCPQKLLKRIFSFITLLLLITSFYYISRRSSLLGLVVFILTLLILGLIFLPQKKEIIKGVGLFIFILFFVFTITYLLGFKNDSYKFSSFKRLKDFIHTSLASGLKTADSSRFDIIKESLHGIKKHKIIGLGYGSFRFVYPRYMEREMHLFAPERPAFLMHPHNEILYNLFEGGAVGTLLIIAPLFLLLWGLIKKIRNADGKEKNLALIVFCSLAGIITTWQFNSTSINPVIRLTLIFYFALGYKLIKESLPTWKVPFFNRSYFKGIFLVIFIFLGIVVIGYSLSSYVLTRAYKEIQVKGITNQHNTALWLAPLSYNNLLQGSLLELRMKHGVKALQLLEKAYGQFPYVPQISYQLAKLYYQSRRVNDAYHVLKKAGEDCLIVYGPSEKLFQEILSHSKPIPLFP